MIVILVALIVASITDIKTREVPDWLSYAFVAGAAGIRIIESLITNSIQPFLFGLAGFGLCFLIGYALYRTAQWGGGDTKLLMGVGAAIGLPWPLNEVPTLSLFLVNMMVTGAMMGIIALVFYGIQYREKTVQEFKKHVDSHKAIGKAIIVGLVSLLAVYILYDPQKVMLIVLPLIVIPPAYYTMLLVKSVEKTVFMRVIPPHELTEGDWLAEPVKVGNAIVVHAAHGGVTKKDIKKLIELGEQGKVKKVVMKAGIPFVPSFLAGYICTIVIGNWFALLL